MRGGDKGVRRHDDLTAQFERADGDLKGNGGVAHGDAMADAE